MLAADPKDALAVLKLLKSGSPLVLKLPL